MKILYNEIGISLVIGKGNWIGLSHEIEEGDYEKRKWGWKKFDFKKVDNYYIRIQVWRQVIILDTKNGLKLKKNKRIGLKLILGVQVNITN